MQSRRIVSILAALTLAGSGLLIAGASSQANAGPNVSAKTGAAKASAPKKKPTKKLKKWTALSIGEDHSCGITTAKTLWCWGYNDRGQLGIGNKRAKDAPTQVNGGGKWLQVSAEYRTTCGIRQDGSLWCWGGNYYYTVGDGTNTDRTKPTRIGTGKDWKSVSVSGFGCGIKKNGSLWCWGTNELGQLGTGDYNTASTPIRVLPDRSWTSVQTASNTTCALAVNPLSTNKRDLLCWGYGQDGELGQGDQLSSPVPVQVPGDWKTISGAHETMCGVRSDSSGWCWGYNDSWQAGVKTPAPALSPVRVKGAWKRIEATVFHTCGIKADSTAWCWGNSWAGALGVGKTSKNNYKLLPTKVKGGSKWRAVVTGPHHSCGIKADKTAWCWGMDSGGKLGNGAKKSSEQWTPVRVAG